MHILLVEDNQHDIFFVQHALKKVEKPVELSVVQDGEQALNFLFHREPYLHVAQPDLILLDINMPRTSGFEVLAARGHDLHLKCLPVIMLTSSTHPRDVTRCYELGANAYIAKPAGIPKLVTILKGILDFWDRCEFPILRQEP
jgi:two-component system, chemotaxis family, response regulator Rcp1